MLNLHFRNYFAQDSMHQCTPNNLHSNQKQLLSGNLSVDSGPGNLAEKSAENKGGVPGAAPIWRQFGIDKKITNSPLETQITKLSRACGPI